MVAEPPVAAPGSRSPRSSPMSAQEPPRRPPGGPEPPEPEPGGRYEAVVPHWFYCKVTDTRERWVPFSAQDSERLEEAHGAGKGGMGRGAAGLRLPPALSVRRPLVLHRTSLLLNHRKGWAW